MGLDDNEPNPLVDNQCDQEDGCYIDVTNTTDPVKECNSSNCSNRDILYRNSTSGLYSHNSSAGNVATVFRRRVYVLGDGDEYADGSSVELDNNDENVVQIRITWSEKFLANKSFIIEHHIFERN